MRMTNNSSTVRILIVAFALAMSSSECAFAVGYDFKLVGGGQVRPVMVQAGSYICVDVKQNFSAPAPAVVFTVWSNIPNPYARLFRLSFDMGNHSDLFTSVSVALQSPGLKMGVMPATPHPFIPKFNPTYAIGLSNPVGYDKRAIAPGQFVKVSATLGRGKTFANVVDALSEGTNSAAANAGLRLGVNAINLLGKNPTPGTTIMDDAGFVINAASSRCGS